MKPVIAVPRGSILPADIGAPVITEGSFLEKMFENMQHKIAVVVLTTEELIVLVERPHLFGIDVVALVGVPGGRYDAVWSEYIAPLRRVSLDTLGPEIRRVNSDGTQDDAEQGTRPDGRQMARMLAARASAAAKPATPSEDELDDRAGTME